MAIYKCKMCGGSLDFEEGISVVTCDFCGSKQTLSKSKDEEIKSLFNRANNLRLKNEFDRAAQIYEKIVEKDDSDAEAHWGIVLCKYGIEYVEDPSTLKRVPTCHRTLFESVVSDTDYLAAIDFSDALQQRIYESEARTIDKIQKDILKIVENEKPFDVFICYKETDDDGKRTIDSAIANDIYYQLTQEGFKVFYAAITLEDKLGQAYEPYIFAALNSAKVMLVVGTNPDYFTAVWVRNEWSRFMNFMKKDRTKLLIPCYKDMDAYDLPSEFAHLQAQDMSKIGFISDVVRGIKKVIAKDGEKAAYVKETIFSNSNSTSDSLLKRAFIFLEDNEWQNADEYFEKVLDADPECAMAYVGKILVEYELSEIEKLNNLSEPLYRDKNYQKAIRYANEKEKKLLDRINETIEKRNNEKLRRQEERLEIINCIKSNNESKVEELLNSDVDVNFIFNVEGKKITPLILAIECSNLSIVKLLLKKGANPNCEMISGEEKFSALIATINNWPNLDIIRELIDAGADVNHVEEHEHIEAPVLIFAIKTSNIAIVKLLIEKGANPNCGRKFSNGNYHSALSDAVVQWPNEAIADLLIRAGANVNSSDRNGKVMCPILINAIIRSNVSMVKLLLNKGANPNCKREFDNGNWCMALSDAAAQWPNYDIANALIEAGADVNALNKADDIKCPILINTIAKTKVDMVKLLLEKGANPNCERKFDNGNYHSALSDAVKQWPNYEIAKALIDSNADVNAFSRVDTVKTPILIDAIAASNLEIVKLLISNGADPNCERISVDGDCFSALYDSVVQWPNIEIAMTLIEAGADVNYVYRMDDVRATILNGAILKSNIKMVRLLLEEGADPNGERIYDDGTRYNALRDALVEWEDDMAVDYLVTVGAKVLVGYSQDAGKRLNKYRFSKETIRVLKDNNVKFNLF